MDSESGDEQPIRKAAKEELIVSSDSDADFDVAVRPKG